MKVLVDTAIWIDYFAAKPTPQVAILEELVTEHRDLHVCGLVITEVLQGIRDDAVFRRTHQIFRTLPYLQMGYPTFVRAASIYRQLRRSGVSIRNTVDCLIAALAIEHNVKLLSADRDFQFIQGQFPLKLI